MRKQHSGIYISIYTIYVCIYIYIYVYIYIYICNIVVYIYPYIPYMYAYAYIYIYIYMYIYIYAYTYIYGMYGYIYIPLCCFLINHNTTQRIIYTLVASHAVSQSHNRPFLYSSPYRIFICILHHLFTTLTPVLILCSNIEPRTCGSSSLGSVN